jgi:hypothetical protein
MVPSWKGGEVKASVSSNLMLSAMLKSKPHYCGFFSVLNIMRFNVVREKKPKQISLFDKAHRNIQNSF